MGLFHRINSCCSCISENVLTRLKTEPVNSVFFHEDNERVFQIVPVQNLLAKQAGPDAVEQYATRNFTGHGFLKCTCRDELPYPIEQLKIDKKDFKALLKNNALYYFDTVYTGNSSYRTLKINTRGFGFENYVLYYQFADNIITGCWLDYNPISETLNTYPERLQHTLHQLGHTYGLILIDWNDCQTVNLANKHALCDYMEQAL